MNKVILIFLYASGIALAVAYGYSVGNITQTITYESDLASCTNICESNGGIERIRTSVFCTCENGALFSNGDVRDSKVLK